MIEPVAGTSSPAPANTAAGRASRFAARAAVLLAVLPAAGCIDGVLDPHGPIASDERIILFNSLGIMLAIVIPTILATLAVAFWFRASNTRARYMPDFHYSGRVEMMVWSVPAMTVFLLGSLCWVSSHDLDPPKPIASSAKPLTVQVVSLDWKWLFIYPEQGIAAVNTLTIPVATPINFELTSSGVMNSFIVPQLAGQIYTMGAMTTRLKCWRASRETMRAGRRISAAAASPTCIFSSTRCRRTSSRRGPPKPRAAGRRSINKATKSWQNPAKR